MRNNRPLVLLLLACCLAQPALGQVFNYWSFGSSDCGQWMKRTDSVGIKNAREAWLAGYLSGINAMYRAEEIKRAASLWPYQPDDDPLGKVNSIDQLILWMDNYCTKNPLSNVPKGGKELFTELTNK